MDTAGLIIIIIATIGIIISLIFGIILLVKYKSTRKKWQLILGIILTFIIPAIIIYYAFRIYPLTGMVYGPGPGDTIVYGPGPI